MDLPIQDFDYQLPQERIALFPLQQRDASKLLVFKNNRIEDHCFFEFPDFIPHDALVIANNSKVIHARILIKKDTGTTIEIFCLDPIEIKEGKALWKCLIGNNKKWKTEALHISKTINNEKIELVLTKKENTDQTFFVEFHWSALHLSFFDLIEQFGQIPLPPYINREVDDTDQYRYQTIYAKEQGSVAAPTAGLHFTDAIYESFKQKNIKFDTVTLHVGAGTFKPVTTLSVLDHQMHAEHFSVSIDIIKKIVQQLKDNNYVIAIGTTSLRTIESIFWAGQYLFDNNKLPETVDQWYPYNKSTTKSTLFILQHLIKWLTDKNIQLLSGSTQIIIIPGYQFRIVNGLLTNFHQPKSTLLLLVSAFTNNEWKRIYHHAIDNAYRFLSYGDCCFLLKNYNQKN